MVVLGTVPPGKPLVILAKASSAAFEVHELAFVARW
jgi:hypothetical protein